MDKINDNKLDEAVNTRKTLNQQQQINDAKVVTDIAKANTERIIINYSDAVKSTMKETGDFFAKKLELATDKGVDFLWKTTTAAPNAFLTTFAKLFNATFRINSKNAGSYISRGANILKFPLLATDGIDQSVVTRFCMLLQQEKAENIRTYFYNENVTLGINPGDVSNEFSSRFYENKEEKIEEVELHRVDSKSLVEKPLKLGKDFMPISPTMISVAITQNFSYTNNNKNVFQILGIKYIPHRIPFNEIKVSFKYGALNSRYLFRFIKWLKGDINFGDMLHGRDRETLNSELTKIALGKKSWSAALKDSTHAVSMLITIDEYNEICRDVVDLDKPTNFKHFQKDVGLLDLIIVDPYAKLFYRINATDNYNKIRHDMRDALNASNKEVVIKTKFEASALNDVDD